jgi:hypothetical protein
LASRVGQAMAFGMSILSAITAATFCLVTPAGAIVGGAGPAPDSVARSIVTIVGSQATFCTGSLIAPNLVLTVAHCVQPGAEYKIVQYDAYRKPQLQDVKAVAIHPAFKMQEMLAHRATADVALLQLEVPAKGKTPARLSTPHLPLAPGNAFTIAGVGVTIRGDGKSAGIIRSAALVATGKPGGAGHEARARRLHRRFRRGGIRGATGGTRDYRRGVLVDRAEWQRRLRRSHRRDAANALSRLDFADRAAMGLCAVDICWRMIFSENRSPLFRIMRFKHCLISRATPTWVDRNSELRSPLGKPQGTETP